MQFAQLKRREFIALWRMTLQKSGNRENGG
jgi:hypothetical protein